MRPDMSTAYLLMHFCMAFNFEGRRRATQTRHSEVCRFAVSSGSEVEAKLKFNRCRIRQAGISVYIKWISLAQLSCHKTLFGTLSNTLAQISFIWSSHCSHLLHNTTKVKKAQNHCRFTVKKAGYFKHFRIFRKNPRHDWYQKNSVRCRTKKGKRKWKNVSRRSLSSKQTSRAKF